MLTVGCLSDFFGGRPLFLKGVRWAVLRNTPLPKEYYGRRVDKSQDEQQKICTIERSLSGRAGIIKSHFDEGNYLNVSRKLSIWPPQMQNNIDGKKKKIKIYIYMTSKLYIFVK